MVKARSYFDAVGNSGDEGLECKDKSLAVQAAKDETDLNNIISKYHRTGELPGMRQGIFADISEMTDLREAMHQANDAMQMFMELPAEVRREFNNDPRQLVDFAMDPRNLPRAEELGLVPKRKEEPTPLPAPKKGGKTTPDGGPPTDT